MTRRVWIAQCLCGPNRHTILVGAGEAEDEADAREAILGPLERTMSALLEDGVVNPWCDLCGAEAASSWLYEVDPTTYASFDEAAVALRTIQEEMIATAGVLGTHGPDKPTKH